MRRCAVVAAALAVAAAALAGPAHAHAQTPKPQQPVPVLAYYYSWFSPSSWTRAKIDYPLLGRYSSDERDVMRTHIRMARAAGIDGFLVSWKWTSQNNERLARLTEIARQERFKLGIVYQGLDFTRRRQSVVRVARDLRRFRDRWGKDPVFALFDRRPLVIWSGTWEFSRDAVRRAAAPVRGDMRVLASEKDVAGVERLRGVVDGGAYYWSSVNPATHTAYPDKLRAMADAVHADGGLWIAPAAPGFDARLVGGHSIVPRDDGATLRTELRVARGASPDAIGIISWNEFSENTHIEPSERNGTRALEVLADELGGSPPKLGEVDSSSTPPSAGFGYGPLLLAFLGISVVAATLVLRRRRRWRQHP
jgi:hypothetical protein